MSAAVAARVRVASSMRLALPALAAATLLLACSDGKPAAPRPAAAPPYKVLELKPESMPVERRLDGTIEAVNQGTVSAQTAGRQTKRDAHHAQAHQALEQRRMSFVLAHCCTRLRPCPT